MFRKLVPILATVAVGAGGSLLVGPGAAAGATMAPDVTPTAFALAASGYGTRVAGGSVPAGSDRSAFQAIGCTNLAGLAKTNAEASVDLGGIGLSSVRTDVWTDKSNGAVSSWSRQRIAKVRVVNPGSPTLVLTGVSSTSHAWHETSGFRAKTIASVGSIVEVVAGVRTELDVPPPGTTVPVPGVGTLTINRGTTDVTSVSAVAMLDAVTLHVTATGTDAFVAHSRAQIVAGVRSALFHGSASSTTVESLQGAVRSGPTPLLLMPCQGTAGAVVTRSIAHAHPAGTVSATGLEVSERAGFGGGAASAYERATVDSVQLTSELEVTSAVAKAHVVKDSSGYHTDVDGTSTGLVVYNGDPVKIPDSGVVRIPGVAKIESGLVTRSARGISVTALRVTLLSGDGAVVEIAKASVSMAPSGR